MPDSKEASARKSAEPRRPRGVLNAFAKSTGASNPFVLAVLTLCLGVILLLLVSRISGILTLLSFDPSSGTPARQTSQTRQEAVSGDSLSTGAAKSPRAEARGKKSVAIVKASPGKSGRPPHRDTANSIRLESFREMASPREYDEGEGALSADWEAGDRETDAPTPESGGQPESVLENSEVGELERDLEISGRVLDEAGDPVSGVELISTALRFFGVAQGTDISPSDGKQQTVSNGFGAYGFYELPAGEYAIRTVATEQYPSTRITVRAGVDFADLVLVGLERSLQISGVVSSDWGEPLERVQVTIPTVLGARGTYSDETGYYELSLAVKAPTRTVGIRFRQEGYQVKQLPVATADSGGYDYRVLDVVLEPVTEWAVVTGSVKSTTGIPVVGETVQLYSPGLRRRYNGVTDPEGNFQMSDVETGDDYRLRIYPKGPYRDYAKNKFEVTSADAYVEIELEPLHVAGRLTGQMVDLNGNPVPHFTLSLRSQSAASRTLQVTGDEQGYFSVENVPEGELVFRSHSVPSFIINGIRMPSGGEEHVFLVLDAGSHEIHGLVLDSGGNPVPVTGISLSWSYTDGSMRSVANRTAAADAAGSFRFTGLGPGQHTLHVNVPGFLAAQLHHDVAQHGDQIVVQLERN